MFVKINDVELFYEIQGQGSPIILLHGNGEDHKIFKTLLKVLTKTHKVYTIDSRCHGQSSVSKNLSYDIMADDIIKFIKKLNIQKPMLYGFSDGGIIGLLIAIREPLLLKKLIISGANLNPAGLHPKVQAKIQKLADRGNVLYQLMAREPNIDPADLSKIEIPTVVLAGQRDVVLEEHTRLIANSIRRSTLEIIPKEDHSSYIVHSKKLYPILKKYI